MNRVLTCFLAGAMALSLHSAAAAQDDAAPPAPESKPVPLSDPAAAMDLLAEDKNGDILGIVFDVVLDDAGKAKTIVLELFDEEAEPAATEDEGAPAEPPAAEDTEAAEPEAAPAEDGAAAEAEGTEEMTVGRLVGVSPQGAMVDAGRDLIMLPAVTAEQVKAMPDFNYEAGMKSVGHPEGYPAE